MGQHSDKLPPAPPELIDAWRTQQWGLRRGRGWGRETAGSLEKMTHAFNVYTAFERFENRGKMTEVEFSKEYFDLWKIVIDVEKLERDYNGR